jgi:AcrR family transcriptional regulator
VQFTIHSVFYTTKCCSPCALYTCGVPRLWTETIDEHRREVHGAILDAAWDLVVEHGPTSVTMSQVAERAGIGRATLYKYFPDVATILLAWHERHVAGHLDRLAAIRDRLDDPGERVVAVLSEYAVIARQRGHGSAELGAFLHRGEHVAHAEQHLRSLVRDLVADAAASGDVRSDVDPAELADYCLAALSAAGSVRSESAAKRLVMVTMAGLRPDR